MNKTYVKKALAVAVILLFIGLAFAPSINANISKESLEDELVEITTEICGLNGGKHTVSLSKEDAEEVEKLIDDIERRLDEVETREEAVEIFNEAVVELDKYGLLGDLSVKNVQRIVSRFNSDSRLVGFFDRVFNKEIREENDVDNKLCLVSTHVIDAISFWFGFMILLFLSGNNIPVALFLYIWLKPFSLFDMIMAFSWPTGKQTEILSYFSIGLKGIKRGGEWDIIFGFTGLKITIVKVPSWYQWYFGFALEVGG